MTKPLVGVLLVKREAIEIAARERPDLVLMYICFPDINGYQVCRAMRAEGLTDTVIVAVTGYGQEADKQKAEEAGFRSTHDQATGATKPDQVPGFLATRALRAYRKKAKLSVAGGTKKFDADCSSVVLHVLLLILQSL